QNNPILGNYRSDQLFDWQPKGEPNPSHWPGELGQKCIVPEDTETYNKYFKFHEFNVLASDRIALNRTLRDSRSDSCQSKQYPNQLPDASVIIVFHNEAYSTLLRTLHIYLKQHLKHYVRELSVPIKIIRLGRRSGLIQARILGSSHAVGRVLIFLDSHCECNEGWLEPLLDRIAGDRTRVVCPIIDVIDEHSFRYVTASDMTYGGFNWKFGFRWYTAPDSELIRRNNDRTLPLRTPALSGGLYAIDRQFFEYIGKYDSKMVIWGAENIEISLRIWMCGGSIEIVTCSRVGHVFRNKTPYTLPGGSNYIVWHNTARLAHVWLDDWTHFFFTLYPSARQIDVGSIFALVLVYKCEAQRTRSRSRSRANRNRSDQLCHLKEVDSCLDKLEAMTKGPNPTAIITTPEGIDKICGTVNEVNKCIKAFIKRCGTPLQREVFDFVSEHFQQKIKQFCDSGPIRENFLKNSVCIHDKVLSTSQHKSNCNNNYLSSLEFAINRTEIDDRIDTLCCGHNTWEDCTDSMIGHSCGSEGQKNFKNLIDKAFGGITTMICPRNFFPPTGNICKKSLPPRGFKAKGRLSDNPISKYVTSYFSFLFSNTT
ncbi:unnamed protein product, partial [Medioppia subpectinata]